MQQTLLTLGALMIITMTSINQQRSNFIAVEGAYIREQENAAVDYATLRIENILNSLTYDEAMTDGSEPELGTLTLYGSFGPDAGENQESDYDDLDDYHGFSESISHALSADTFRFQVDYSVRYVDPSNPSQPTSASSMAKELTVSVVSRDSIGHRVARYEGAKITLASDNQ